MSENPGLKIADVRSAQIKIVEEICECRHRFSMLSNAPQVEADGYIAVPHGPGPGVEIDRAMIDG